MCLQYWNYHRTFNISQNLKTTYAASHFIWQRGKWEISDGRESTKIPRTHATYCTWLSLTQKREIPRVQTHPIV